MGESKPDDVGDGGTPDHGDAALTNALDSALREYHRDIDSLQRLQQLGHIDGEGAHSREIAARERLRARTDTDVERALRRSRDQHSFQLGQYKQGKELSAQALSGVFLVAGAGLAASVAYSGQHGTEGWRYYVMSFSWCALALSAIGVIATRLIAGFTFGLDDDTLGELARKPKTYRRYEAKRLNADETFESYIERGITRMLNRAQGITYGASGVGIIALLLFHIVSVPPSALKSEVRDLRQVVEVERDALRSVRSDLDEARSALFREQRRAIAAESEVLRQESAARTMGEVFGRVLRGGR